MQTRKYFKTIVWWPGLLVVVLLFSGAGRRPARGACGVAVASMGDAGGIGVAPTGDAGGIGVAPTGDAGGIGVAPTGDAVGWMTVEQAAEKLQQEQRPVLIDLYTTWCGWCREMDKKTYSSKKVAAYLGEKFYTVKVDAETRAEITWQGRTYAYNPQYRSNEFAVFLTHGQLEFPTTIIIAPGEAPQAIPGYLEPGDLEPLVRYFGEGAYKTQGFDVYMKNFKKSW